MNIIGLGYRAGVGKDTVAGYLKGLYKYVGFAFADPLKEAAFHIFGLPPQIDRSEKETPLEFWGMSPRQIWQKLGTEAMKPAFGEDIWARAMERRIHRYRGLVKNIVVTDVRFLCEIEAIKKWGGKVVRVDRTIAAPVATHRSESELENYTGWDFVIDNNGNFVQLQDQIKQLVAT